MNRYVALLCGMVLVAGSTGCYWRPGYFLHGGQYGAPYAQPVYAQPPAYAAPPAAAPVVQQPVVVQQPACQPVYQQCIPMNCTTTYE